MREEIMEAFRGDESEGHSRKVSYDRQTSDPDPPEKMKEEK